MSDDNPKPISVWPLMALLVIVIFLIFWVYGGMAR
jgi:hypothetical protein